METTNTEVIAGLAIREERRGEFVFARLAFLNAQGLQVGLSQGLYSVAEAKKLVALYRRRIPATC